MPNEVFSWQHIFTEALIGSLPILAALWLSHRDSSKKAEQRDQKLNFVLTEHPLHSHGEYKDQDSSGPLLAENMRFPKIRLNGNKP